MNILEFFNTILIGGLYAIVILAIITAVTWFSMKARGKK